LDVDGNTGGYNIQFALTTGKIVSEFFEWNQIYTDF
jgi:predicted flavoprotein YhiN